VLNLQRRAQLIELMLAAGLFVTGEETIREFLAVVRQTWERFFRKALALLAVLSSFTSRYTQRVARSMATKR
jgi:hypothetical protein